MLRKPETAFEKSVVKLLEIKNPLVEIEDGSIGFISGNCLFCDESWKYKLKVELLGDKALEIELLDGRALEPVRKYFTAYLCEDCYSDCKDKWGSERIEVILVRVVVE